MGLGLKDKFNLTKRFIKVLFSNTDQIGLTWKDGTRIQSYHVYNDKVVERYNVHLEYMAQAAADYLCYVDKNINLVISDDSDPSNVEISSTDERDWQSFTADGTQIVKWIDYTTFTISVADEKGDVQELVLMPFIERSLSKDELLKLV